jgi:UDP:flavonoid glycosyltransferase YjiC (YdhE family)
MTKYVFFNFPAHGHVNPTLAIVEELVARGEEVVYYLPDHFRSLIEATGATFRSAPFNPFNQDRERTPVVDPADGDKRLAMLPIFLLQKSPQVVMRVQTMQQQVREAEGYQRTTMPLCTMSVPKTQK